MTIFSSRTAFIFSPFAPHSTFPINVSLDGPFIPFAHYEEEEEEARFGLNCGTNEGGLSRAGPSPPGEGERVEKVIAPRQEVLLHDARLDVDRVALTPDVLLHAVQQVGGGGPRVPRSKGHHRVLVGPQAADSVVVASQVLLRAQNADHHG